MKTGPLATSRKIKKLSRLSERNIGQIYMCCEVFTHGAPEYGDVVYAAFYFLSLILACMTWWMHVLFIYPVSKYVHP